MSLKFNDTVMESGNTDAGYMASFGIFSSTNVEPRNKVSSSRTKIVDICADDAGATLPNGTPVCANRSRMLVTATQTGEASAYGARVQVKATGDVSATTGWIGGVWGYAEAVSGTTVGNKFCGVNAMVDVPSGATIAANCYASGVHISSYTLGGTHTGKAVGIHFGTPRAGAFDAAMKFDASSGIATQSGGTLTITKKIAIVDDAGNVIYIPAGTIA